MADVTGAVAASHAKAPHQTGHSRRAPKRKLKAWQQKVQAIAPKPPKDTR